MSKLRNLILKAEHSSFYRWLLNMVLARSIPFNAPHCFRVIKIKQGSAEIMLPYRRRNLNHVKGIHACALATLCEFTTGLTLISTISENEYRIILKSIRVDYHFQARMDVIASFSLNEKFIEKVITGPLQFEDAIFTEMEIKVNDMAGNHICTGFINWQVKKWNKVKSMPV